MSKSNSHPEIDIHELEKRLDFNHARLFRKRVSKLFWHMRQRGGYFSKRLVDVSVALSALVVLSPLMVIVAAIIKASDGGSVLFWQTRIGMWGRTFRFPKFRSMVVNAEALQKSLSEANLHGQDITFKIKRDPRITRIGSFIRKTSIDELPQLWCVVKGDMSLVGPRPPLVKEVALYSLDDRRRLEAVPGLTCTWQISGRSDIPFQQQLKMDVEYIEQQSLKKDFGILLKTVPAVIAGRGAY